MNKQKQYRKWLKWLKKDIAKGCGIPKRKLFGKHLPITPISLILTELKKEEKENILWARKQFEESFKKELQKEYPEFVNLKFILKWKDEVWFNG